LNLLDVPFTLYNEAETCTKWLGSKYDFILLTYVKKCFKIDRAAMTCAFTATSDPCDVEDKTFVIGNPDFIDWEVKLIEATNTTPEKIICTRAAEPFANANKGMTKVPTGEILYHQDGFCF
jgi:hypothetical protein